MNLKFEVVTGPEPDRCEAKRGPRSKTQCELPAGHTEDWHIGRSPTGKWFSWSTNPKENDGPRRDR